jgi:hypothetical protein
MNPVAGRRLLLLFCTVTLCSGVFSTVAAAQSAEIPVSVPDSLEQCLTLNEPALRSDLSRVTRRFFSSELNAVDLPRMVENKWLELGLPNLLETEVNRAVDSVRAETGFTRRFTSSFSPAQTTELAEQIANRAFASAAFRSRLETLADEVAADFTGSFASVAARSASSATACVQSYLGSTYGNAVSAAFEAEVRAQLEATGADALTGNVRPEGVVGLRSGVGAATIAGGYVARAVAQRLSAQVSRRIAGNITARILGRAGSTALPVIGWAVGGGLIAWDVVGGAVRGPFPAIQRQLAGEETQAQIQREIAASLREDLPAVSAELSRGVADEIFAQWQRFTQNFKVVLALAERNAAFKQELSGVPEIDLYKLAEIVRLVPEKTVLQAVQDGQLRQVVGLPEDALEILETTSSPADVLTWANLAGTRLDDVVDTEVYRYKNPTDFSQRTLARLLDTDDVVTIAKVASLPRREMDTLLELPTVNLNALTAEFSSRQLETVAWYANALAQEPLNALIVRLIEHPPRLEKFAPEAVRHAVAGSREPLAAVALVGSEPGVLVDLPLTLGRDLSTVLAGGVSGRLLWAKYNLSTLLLLAATTVALLLTLFALLSRPFRHRRVRRGR